MRWRSFFKTMVICLFLATACLSGAYANGEKDGLSCEKGSACSPMMDAWCQQNGLTIDKNKEAGHYKYVNPINCTNPLCCIDASMYECERVQRKRARSKEDQIECRQNIHFGGGGIIDCDWEYYYMFRCKSVMQPDNPMSIITCKDQLFTSTLKSCTGGHTCYTIERHGWSGSKTGSIKYVSCVKSGETAETEGISLFVESLLDIDTSGCWLCPLLEEIFVMGDKLATAIYEQISVAMLLFLGVWAALLLLWLVFRAFVDFSGKEVRSFLQKSGALFLRIAVVATLLAVTPRIFGEWFYDPFISLSSGVSPSS